MTASSGMGSSRNYGASEPVQHLKARAGSAMRLWHLRRTNPHPDWDETIELVVRAASEQEAREIAATRGETYAVVCEPLEHDGEPGVVVRAFKAG